jgi:hypothetical protein
LPLWGRLRAQQGQPSLAGCFIDTIAFGVNLLRLDH